MDSGPPVKLITVVCKVQKTVKTLSACYHLNSNGSVEDFNWIQYYTLVCVQVTH